MMDTKTKILKLLRYSDGYVSGQSLCETFGVSRTAIWKYVNQLKEDGYEFDAVSNKGYRIVKYPDIITKEEIESQLDGETVCKIAYFDETDSTNTRAKLAAEAGEPSGTLFVAESQTGGKGRRGRAWVSPAGSGIWMSLLLRPEIKPYDASMLTIVAVMALVKAISEVTGESCKIKWPNDIVMGERKICGILTEMSAELEQINYVVVGIGINVNTTDFDDSIKDMASSIFLQTGVHVKRSSIIAAFARHFSKYYDEFLENLNLSGLVEDYNESLINAGREVRIIERGGEYTATAVGIDETGMLEVKLPDGETKKIVSGEVSVRGLYGYV
jgi:BirA family biotin operon repressor/biotin-[acetyl-CoA-carboxylase] ligase